MANREFAVLFLCTRNSARSIMAECAMNRWGKGEFRGFSAGSNPAGTVHPMTLQLLNELNYETRRLRSKSWDEFARPAGPPLDFTELENRIKIFTSLPFDSLDRFALERRVREIGMPAPSPAIQRERLGEGSAEPVKDK
ncbi:MAG: arsenate reductase ArsC [Candidatus Binatus sp.]